MLAHVLKEVFLAPPREHRDGYPTQIPQVVGREDRRLMAAGIALPHFPNPKAIAQPSASLGQFQLHLLTVDQTYLVRTKLRGRPLLLGKLVIGDDGNPLLPAARKKLWRIPGPVKNHREASRVAIGFERFGARLAGHLL